MCVPAVCKRCGKTTWAGCGEHVDEVMSGVPKAQQCLCDGNQSPAGAGQSQPAEGERAR